MYSCPFAFEGRKRACHLRCTHLGCETRARDRMWVVPLPSGHPRNTARCSASEVRRFRPSARTTSRSRVRVSLAAVAAPDVPRVPHPKFAHTMPRPDLRTSDAKGHERAGVCRVALFRTFPNELGEHAGKRPKRHTSAGVKPFSQPSVPRHVRPETWVAYGQPARVPIAKLADVATCLDRASRSAGREQDD